jgi:hypothetical protein
MALKEAFTQLLENYPDLLQQGKASLALLIPLACRLACPCGPLAAEETTQGKTPSRSLHQGFCTKRSGLSALVSVSFQYFGGGGGPQTLGSYLRRGGQHMSMRSVTHGLAVLHRLRYGGTLGELPFADAGDIAEWRNLSSNLHPKSPLKERAHALAFIMRCCGNMIGLPAADMPEGRGSWPVTHLMRF